MPNATIFKEVSGEKIISTYESLTLTNKRLIQWFEDAASENLTQIPLEKIDSMSYSNELNISLVAIGILVALVSFFVDKITNISVMYVGLIIGVIIILIAFAIRKPVFQIKSASETISESSRGIESFVNDLEKEVYCN